jgi:hypothetical protein
MTDSAFKPARTPRVNRVALVAALLVGIAVFFTTGYRSRLILLGIAAAGLLVTVVGGLRARARSAASGGGPPKPRRSA